MSLDFSSDFLSFSLFSREQRDSWLSFQEDAGYKRITASPSSFLSPFFSNSFQVCRVITSLSRISGFPFYFSLSTGSSPHSISSSSLRIANIQTREWMEVKVVSVPFFSERISWNDVFWAHLMVRFWYSDISYFPFYDGVEGRKSEKYEGEGWLDWLLPRLVMEAVRMRMYPSFACNILIMHAYWARNLLCKRSEE